MKLKSELKEDVDWRIVGVTSSSLNGKTVDWGVQVIKECPYKDMILLFGEIQIEEDEENDKGKLSFDFDIFHHAGKDIENDDADLQEFAGDLLVAVFTQALDEGKAIINGISEPDDTTITLDE